MSVVEHEVIKAALDAQTLVAWGGGIMSFVAALIGSFIMWRKAKAEDKRAQDNHDSSDATEFRADLLEFTKTLTSEINVLRDRIRRLEEDVLEKNKTVIKLQNHIGMISRVLMHDHGINVEDILRDKEDA